MCGISGFYHRRPGSPSELTELARKMATRIRHRGPDDSGEFVDERNGLGLGFRRLSIIDLTEAGHQPMRSASGRYTLIFNGEIYNFAAIREELDRGGLAPRWRGHADSEVILAAVEAWGLKAAVERFRGMFGFALWDAAEETLHLIRDRVGVKPLFYAQSGDTIVFGSELKALTAHPAVDRTVDRDALALYARFGYVPSPFTIYKGTRKQPPGTILTIPRSGELRIDPYWSFESAIARAKADPFRGSEAEAIAALEGELAEAVKLRMIADVPLGVFLSGGIDSTAVTALMQAQAAAPVRTFSIGFEEAEFDEARNAAVIARHLGTDHTEFYVKPEDARAVIPMLASMYDEPFSDSSQIPTYLVSKLARQSVTVALSGDGGDELFAGYHRHFLGRALWQKSLVLPPALRAVATSTMLAVPVTAWNLALSPKNRLLPKRVRRERAGERIHKLARSMRLGSPDAMYYEVVSRWTGIVKDAQEPLVAVTDRASWPALDDYTERAMYLDQVSYLRDDILVKVDRASMAVSLEAREPLLDHKLIEFAWRLPLSMKVRDGKGKWILRRVLSRYVPDALMDQPKRGFSLPIGEWLRGPLRDWCESLLDEQRLHAEGFFTPEPIRRKWEEHLSGRGEWEHWLWSILMFQAWLDETKAA